MKAAGPAWYRGYNVFNGDTACNKGVNFNKIRVPVPGCDPCGRLWTSGSAAALPDPDASVSEGADEEADPGRRGLPGQVLGRVQACTECKGIMPSGFPTASRRQDRVGSRCDARAATNARLKDLNLRRQQHALKSKRQGVATIDDALELRGRILSAFDLAELDVEHEQRTSWLAFAVVGAGPTGAELAGQVADLSRRALHLNSRGFDPAKARVTGGVLSAVLSGGPSRAGAAP
jgi:hypothetical protein